MADLNSAGSSQHVVVMGAGPAGLSAAHELSRHGTPVTVVEKDGQVGGIARTIEFMGCRFDVGPHRFFSQSPEIEALWTEILGDEIRPVSRLTRILYQGKFFDYPIRASNAFLNLGPIETARCLASYARARLRPVENPTSFEDRVSNQFGRRLFEILFKNYGQKVCGISTPELSADWAAESRLGETLTGPIAYPRGGVGQILEAIVAQLGRVGSSVRVGEEVVAVRHAAGRVLSVVARDRRGGTLDILGSQFVSTLPVRELIARLQPAVPSLVRSAAEALRYRELVSVNLVIDRARVFPDQWIYVHDPAVQVARIWNFKNLSCEMVSDSGLSGLGLEYFCSEGEGLWDMSDAELLDLGRRELIALGICQPDEVKAGMVHRQPNAYLVYDRQCLGHLAMIREWLARALPNLSLAGRATSHDSGLLPAPERIVSGNARHRSELQAAPHSRIYLTGRSGVAQR